MITFKIELLKLKNVKNFPNLKKSTIILEEVSRQNTVSYSVCPWQIWDSLAPVGKVGAYPFKSILECPTQILDCLEIFSVANTLAYFAATRITVLWY